MSSRSVQIIGEDADGTGRQHANVDKFNDALVVQDEIHTNIHRGLFFTGSAQSAIGSDSSLEFLIKVGSTRSCHVRFLGTVRHDMTVELFEAPTTSADGASVATPNRNRFSPITAVTTIFAGPTVSVDGTSLFEGYIPGGNKQTASGGQGDSFEEWILATDTNYLIRINNDIVAPAAAGHIGLVIDFYEPSA